MKNGYKVIWTEPFYINVNDTLDYLESKWPKKVIKHFATTLDKTINLIAEYPHIFPASNANKNIRKAVVTKHNSLYYLISEDKTIHLLFLFSNFQNPDKLEL